MSRFDREKTNCNICTIKSRNSEVGSFGSIIADTLKALMYMDDMEPGDGMDAVCYETENRHYTHMDFKSPIDFGKGIINLDIDGAVLVVDATEGIAPDLSLQLSFAKLAGIYYLTVFVDNCNLTDDEHMGELDDEIRMLLDESGYCGDEVYIVYGSVKEAENDPESEWGEKILELLELMDESIPDPEKDNDKPFLMAVEDLFNVTGRGVVATGRVETGVIKLNSKVEIAGLGAHDHITTVTGIEMFGKLLESAETGDNVGLLLRGDLLEIKRGQVIASVGTIKSTSEFTAVVHFYGRKSLEDAYALKDLNFRIRTADFSGEISISDDDISLEGQLAKVAVRLTDPIALKEKDWLFVYDKDGNKVGIGRVIELL